MELCSPPRTAQELLLEFKSTGRQEPFEEIVRRYAGMVFHVCLRITRNNHDAEDATQAVFLTLAVQARQNKEIRYIGPWLQQVAHRLSLDLRKSKKRREKREERHSQAAGGERVECECAQQLHCDEMKAVINQEINKLPPKYRVPLIMHYFGGLSREEMATELHCKPGTLGVRLHRAREMLRARLARRGMAMAEGTMSLAIAYAVQSVVAEHIIVNTCQAASHIVVGNPLTSHLVPAQLVAMARGAVHSVLVAKVKTVAALLVAMGCAMAAGAEVVSKVTPLDLGFDLQLRIGDWVKEHLLPFSSPLQVNATEAGDAGAERVTPAPMVSSPMLGHGTFSPAGHPFELASTPPKLIAPMPPELVKGGVVIGGQEDAGIRMAMRLAPGIVPDDAPRRVHGEWDGLTMGPVGPPSVQSLTPRPYHKDSFRLSGAGSLVSMLPVVRDVRPDGAARLNAPVKPGPWRPQLPIAPDRGGIDGGDGGHTGGGDRPDKPGKPGDGKGGGDDNKPRQPVQVAASGAGAVNIYLPPHTESLVARTPRSPAALSLAAADSPLSAGNETTVNFDSVSGVVFRVSATTFSNAINGSVLQSASDFSGLEWNVAPPLDVFSAGDAASESNYTDRTLFRLDPETRQLVVLGRQSRAKLTGVTVESTSGRLSGWGTVGPADSFDQSGQVVADGLGQPRVLNLSDIRVIRNGTENTGANGWYARNGGKVVLPEMRVLPGSRTYTWGEDPSDVELDLVNSVRLRIRDALTPGMLRIALTSPDRGEVPPLPNGERVVGLWQFDAAGIRAEGADLSVRYDDGLIADLGLTETSVRLWAYGGGTWKPVQDGFSLDPVNNIVRGSIDSATFFAVAVTPEPGMLGVMVGANFLMLRRRRR